VRLRRTARYTAAAAEQPFLSIDHNDLLLTPPTPRSTLPSGAGADVAGAGCEQSIEEYLMGVLADCQIRERISIEPFEAGRAQPGVISYGLSSYGYDIRVGRRFKIFTNVNSAVVDPKSFSAESLVDFEGDRCIIPPNSFALAETVERVKLPRDVLGICLGKSTYARCGIIVNVTPIEPEWEGVITLEISNTTPLPAVIHANEGIAQLVFLQAEAVCERSYPERGGRYHRQEGLTLPRVDE
jgi:dCTP deaminase